MPPEKLAEVAGLATALADRILEQHAAGTTIAPNQFHMLVNATRMLQDNGVPWPPSVEHVLMEVAKRAEPAEVAPHAGPAATKGDDVVGHLTQVLHAMRRA
ncbi:hypothetical protein MKK67_06725 [Methylobacterium sp. J-072]|uniref:hypothetical protein n=1 Tax=Methylobacterium sp. J-072 TaxID=2836651 RepID=UPI001FB91804|nr:hypothetical protein [Methylobacterium sp. J-072]MCJ2092190.1 hypothetical protein [Methylobacterium sp. J-072]